MARQNIQPLASIQFFRGDTNRCTFIRQVDDQPIDITGYAYLFTISRVNSPLAAQAAADQIMQLTGIVDPDQANNTGAFSFSPTVNDWMGVPEGDFVETPAASGILVASYFYDIQETQPSGPIETLGKGIVQVLMDITK